MARLQESSDAIPKYRRDLASDTARCRRVPARACKVPPTPTLGQKLFAAPPYLPMRTASCGSWGAYFLRSATRFPSHLAFLLKPSPKPTPPHLTSPTSLPHPRL